LAIGIKKNNQSADNREKTVAISIIIPAYNEERFLGRCLQSIANVDYPGELTEVLLVDNGSTDRTVEIAHSYNAKVLVDGTSNVSGLRNLGAQHAKGELLAFVDADCIVHEDWISGSVFFIFVP